MANSAFDVTGVSSITGVILQVVQTQITSLFSTSSGSYVDVTGLNVTITPSSITSKILLMLSIQGGISGTGGAAIQLLRGSTPINIGAVNGSNVQATAIACNPNYTNSGSSIVMNYLDSPATTSPITYKIQGISLGGTLHIGQTSADTSSNYATFPSTIIAMEVSG